MKIYVELINGKLSPVNKAGEERFDKLKEKKWYAIDPSSPRYIKFHAKYWATLGEIVKQSDCFTGITAGTRLLHNEIKLACGHYDTVYMNIGGVEIEQRIPLSTDFPSLDEEGFREYFERGMDYLVAQPRLNTEGII